MADKRQILFNAYDESRTAILAKIFAKHAADGQIILLSGPLGSGKSLFARSYLRALGVTEDIPSPTFTLVQTYQTNAHEIWHADLYRLTHPDEIIELGLEDAIDHAISLIEWPDNFGDTWPNRAIEMSFTITKEDTRNILIRWTDKAWDRITSEIADA